MLLKSSIMSFKTTNASHSAAQASMRLRGSWFFLSGAMFPFASLRTATFERHHSAIGLLLSTTRFSLYRARSSFMGIESV